MSIDPRLMERRKTVAEDNAKRSVSRLLKFLLFLVLVAAVTWLVFSPWLSVKQVNTTGVEASSSHSILSENGVRAGTPMILVNASRVEALLNKDPWVAEAHVVVEWPNTVTVDVIEREPAAWVRSADGWTRRAIDGFAVPSESEPDNDMARIDMPELAEGEAEGSIEMLGALEFVTALPPDLQSGTVVEFRDNELWATVEGYEVRLGRSADMTEKALSLTALLQESIPDGSTLIVIAPTNPSFLPPAVDTDGDDDDGGDGEGSDDQNDDS